MFKLPESTACALCYEPPDPSLERTSTGRSAQTLGVNHQLWQRAPE